MRSSGRAGSRWARARSRCGRSSRPTATEEQALTDDRTPGIALTRIAREEGGRLLALLSDRLGDLEAAHDSLQDAYAKAAVVWADAGVPRDPAAWVYVVARNAGIDRLRREAAAGRRVAAQARILDTAVAAQTRGDQEDGLDSDGIDGAEPRIAELAHVGDERLRLLLLCCHPALSRDTQVALTLRLAGGLTTEEVAGALLIPAATVQQRIVRAKRKIRAAGMPLVIPQDLSKRAKVLATVLGLIFNEGYVAHAADAPRLTRVEVADQAIRLTATAADALPEEPELAGLLALQLFHRSREAARTDATGALVRLADQDRSRWDRAMIAQGFTVLSQALSHRRLGPWQVQALIAAEHTRSSTDWRRVLRYHDRLLQMGPSPVARLARAVALAEVEGPAAALQEVESIGGLERYHLFHAARADLLERMGDAQRAAQAWDQAAALASNPAERAHLERRRRDLGPIPTVRDV